jgi:hypothetical protein
MIGELWKWKTSLFVEGYLEEIILNNFIWLLVIPLQPKRR